MCVSRIFVSIRNPWFLRQIMLITRQILRAPLQMACFLRRVPPRPSVMGGGVCCARKARCAKLVGGMDSNGWVCAGVRETILALNIYYSKPNTKPNSQSGSQVCKGLGNQALGSIGEYDLATLIVICPLTQPLKWRIGSSTFAVMSGLKVAITTWPPLPSIPST